MLYFSSDWHYGHEKILTMGTGRPFPSSDAMNTALLTNMATLTYGDTLYFLGDAVCGVGAAKLDVIVETFAPLFTRGVIIHWIKGNHDPSLSRLSTTGLFASVTEMLTIKVPVPPPAGVKSFAQMHKEIVLCHYPLEDWEFEANGTIHLHGHRHGAGTRHTTRRRLDIGVDGHDYKPWSLDEVMAEMRRTPWAAPNHHV